MSSEKFLTAAVIKMTLCKHYKVWSAHMQLEPTCQEHGAEGLSPAERCAQLTCQWFVTHTHTCKSDKALACWGFDVRRANIKSAINHANIPTTKRNVSVTADVAGKREKIANTVLNTTAGSILRAPLMTKCKLCTEQCFQESTPDHIGGGDGFACPLALVCHTDLIWLLANSGLKVSVWASDPQTAVSFMCWKLWVCYSRGSENIVAKQHVCEENNYKTSREETCRQR